MRISTHRHYDKAWAKLTRQQQKRVLEALEIFMENPTDRRLRVHRLSGEYSLQYSLSAGGDLRVHYQIVTTDLVRLMHVGTHAQLYE